MSIDQSQREILSLPRFLRPSHRTRPEQLVGLGIFLLISFGFQLACYPCSFCLALSMWTLWRRYSLRVLKLELSAFLAQFLFQAAWAVSSFALHQTLLALVALLLLWCTTLLATLLFWKKEPIAGWLLVFPLLWIFYLVGSNMVICISYP